MNTFFAGDMHLGHRNIIKYCNRPFKSVEEMNETLIDNWNKVINKFDTVIVNGDFSLVGKDKCIEFGQRLKGRKILVLGNHDSCSLKTYYEAGFEIVSKYPIVFDNFAIVSHQPLFVNENSPYGNIYAHVHDNPMYQDVTSTTFCTSMERINFTPISYEEIRERMAKIEPVTFEEAIKNWKYK